MPTQPHLYADNPNAKRILIVCDEGVNRSHTIKGQLQYWGHDILTVGLNRNSEATIYDLANWADLIIFTDKDQVKSGYNNSVGYTLWHTCPKDKMQIWDIGEDKYTRPYNSELLMIVRKLIDEHREELAPVKDKAKEKQDANH